VQVRGSGEPNELLSVKFSPKLPDVTRFFKTRVVRMATDFTILHIQLQTFLGKFRESL